MHRMTAETAIHRATPEQVRAVRNRARQLQSKAMSDALAGAARGIASGARWIVSTTKSLLLALGQARAANRSHFELSRLDDRELADLADIGLTRNEIYRVAWGLPQRAEDRAVFAADVAQEAVGQDYRKAA